MKYLFIVLMLLTLVVPVHAQEVEQPAEPVVVEVEEDVAWQYAFAALIALVSLGAFVYDRLGKERLERAKAQIWQELQQRAEHIETEIAPVVEFLGQPVVNEILDEVKSVAQLVAKTTLTRLDLETREERISYLTELVKEEFKHLPIAQPSDTFIEGAVLQLVEEVEDLID